MMEVDSGGAFYAPFLTIVFFVVVVCKYKLLLYVKHKLLFFSWSVCFLFVKYVEISPTLQKLVQEA